MQGTLPLCHSRERAAAALFSRLWEKRRSPHPACAHAGPGLCRAMLLCGSVSRCSLLRFCAAEGLRRAPLCAAAAGAAKTTRAAPVQAPAKSMRQLNKENEDLQAQVDQLTGSLQSAQAGKQAVKAAYEVRVEAQRARSCSSALPTLRHAGVSLLAPTGVSWAHTALPLPRFLTRATLRVRARLRRKRRRRKRR